uniref:YbbR-like domain-containing protein n=1 Tax=Fundidesulfovibrio putealis TaxID=270496 RepID=A0A7C4AGI6_9BACT
MGGQAMTNRWYAKLLALFLAVLSWYLVSGRERVDTWVRVRIETAGLADGLVLRGAPREHLDVLVRGPRGLVRKLDPSDLVFTLDARKLSPGQNTVVIEPHSVPLSNVFEVVEIRPSKLEVTVERRTSKPLPVRLRVRDQLARDYRFSATLEPPVVTVTGPESLLKDLNEVVAELQDPPMEAKGSFDAVVSPLLPDQVESAPRTLKASVKYQLNMREAALDTPVRLLYHGKGAASVAPDSVLIKFRAPAMLLREGAWRGLVDAYVEVAETLPPGRHDVPYRVTLPQGCELIQARPETVSVIIK